MLRVGWLGSVNTGCKLGGWGDFKKANSEECGQAMKSLPPKNNGGKAVPLGREYLGSILDVKSEF